MKTVLIVLLGILFPLTAVAAGKPFPPQQLAGFFAEIVALEDAIGEGEWDEAQATLNEIKELHEIVAPLVETQLGAQSHAPFEKSYADLVEIFATRDKQKISAAIITMQDKLFNVMDGFLYLVHPAVLVIEQYVNEGLEALERGDFERVEHEIEETLAFIDIAGPILDKKGAGEGMRSDFKRTAANVRQAAEKKDVERAEVELKRLKRISSGLVWMASQP